MRLGLIVYGSLETVSGGYLYDRMLVDDLRRREHTVEVLSLPWRGYLRHLGDNLDAQLAHRLRGERFDVLLQDELNHPSLVWLNRRLRPWISYPIVSIVHHLRSSEAWPPSQRSIYRWVERHYLATVDALVCNSQTTRRAVERLAGGARPAVVAYPAGDRLRPTVGPDEIGRRARRPGPLQVLFIGNLIARKGLHTLIESLARSGWDDWRLTVVGSLTVEPSYVAAIRRRIKEAGLNERIRLLGAVSDGALVGHLAESHVLAMPSAYEGYGIVYLEAMGFGLPVIASRAGGAGELVVHGHNGFLVTPGDAPALAGHLRSLGGNRERLVELSLAARDRYLAHPTWAETTGQIHDFLQGFVADWYARPREAPRSVGAER